MTAGSLRIAASHRGGATIVDRLRQEGLMRCSRAFAEPGGGARLVVAHLGPGFVRGDRYAIDGELGERASLVVASQSAARLLGRGATSEATASWTLAAGARLYCAAEPTIAYADAAHRARTVVRLERGASLAWLDALAAHGPFDRVATSLRIFFGSTLALHDAFDLVPRHLVEAVGTAVFVRSGMSRERSAHLVAAADAAMADVGDPNVAFGVASPAAGGVFVRATGRHVRAVRAALAGLLALLRRIDEAPDAPFV